MGKIFYKENYLIDIRKKQPWRVFEQLYFDLRCCYQRMRYGWCEKDAWSISDWFLDVMPEMLSHMRYNKMGSPVCLGPEIIKGSSTYCDKSCHDEWNKILDEMIYLLREAKEETCTRRNPYEEAHSSIYAEFEIKYGLFGRNLEPTGSHSSTSYPLHFPHELDEYKEVEEQYMREEKNIEEYRNQCKDKALTLFSKWFWHLWD